jgi:hypothetical protein
VRVEHPDPGGEPLAAPAPPPAPSAPEPGPAVDVPPRAPEQWRGFGRR